MSAATGDRPIEILLVEDNPGDVRLTREILMDGRVSNALNVVIDGVEAMRYLRREGRYAGVPKTDLVLLDLNLPKMDGREVLSMIRSDPALQRIPVIILTTSQDEEDVIKTYNLCANGYIIKPVDLDQFFRVIRQIKEFWMSIVLLPSNESK